MYRIDFVKQMSIKTRLAKCTKVMPNFVKQQHITIICKYTHLRTKLICGDENVMKESLKLKYFYASALRGLQCS